jgi:hypothetical protein
MARTDGSVTRRYGQVLTARTDTSSQGAQHKVSGEPTPHIQGQIKCSLAQCSNPCQISPTERDFLALDDWANSIQNQYFSGISQNQ